MIDRMANLRAGFLTTRACGTDGIYELKIKFQSLEELDAADSELRAAFDREEIDGQPLTGNSIAAPGAAIAAREQPTDDEILALNAGERLFSESPSRYPEAGFGTQYHTGKPGLLQFAREVLALASLQEAPAASASPATVAQPLTDEQIIEVWNAWPRQGVTSRKTAVEFARAVLAIAPAAQPCSSQGCGGDGGVETASMYAQKHGLAVTVEWMRGWNACLDAVAALSTDKGDGGSK